MIGTTISHYRITSKLGEGGMGVVYSAEDTRLERTVALKFLAAHAVADEEWKERFAREAKASAALWRRDGREFYFLSLPGDLMAATAAGPVFGVPQKLYDPVVGPRDESRGRNVPTERRWIAVPHLPTPAIARASAGGGDQLAGGSKVIGLH